jgi:hypothetical protein
MHSTDWMGYLALALTLGGGVGCSGTDAPPIGNSGDAGVDGPGKDGAMNDGHPDADASGDSTTHDSPPDAPDVTTDVAETGMTDACNGTGTCMSPGDCPTPASDCVTVTCAAGCCGSTPVAEETVCTTSGGHVCDATGHCVECVVAADCPPSTTVCASPACSTNTCGSTNASAGTPCTDNGGVVCDGFGSCTSMHCADKLQDADETDVDCGGGTCPACPLGDMCKVDGDCTSGACDSISLTCVASECSDHTKDGMETDVDCGGGTCPACPLGDMCKVDGDCTSTACDAISLTCVASECGDHLKDGMETDVDCGGGACPSCTIGKVCKVDADCSSRACDALSLTCVASQCNDHLKDGMETDVDCGGGTCATCAVGKKCKTDGDCASNACDSISLTCVASQCSDMAKDGAETDIDCGGGTCPTCANGKMCKVDGDCTSDACDAISLTCVASQCIDMAKDGAETDVDCGGGTCPTCGNGKMCKVDGDCTSNACDAISLTCVANQCADDRQDGAETDIDCGGGTCAGCAVGKKCEANTDCQVGHTCSITAPHICL